MTLVEAEKRVDEIRKAAGDYEIAHSLEDQFRHEVLQAIANGHDKAEQLAQIALCTSGINFPRHTA